MKYLNEDEIKHIAKLTGRPIDEVKHAHGVKACLKVFQATRDSSDGTDPYQCGLSEGHEGSCAWRGDLPGGRITSVEAVEHE